MLKKTLLAIFIPLIAFTIFIPCIMYWKTFHIYGISTNNQDWSNLGSFIGGIYSATFGLISTFILCATLYYTLNYNKKQLSQLQNDSIKSLLVHHINSLNEKLNNRKNKYYSAVNFAFFAVNENDYLEALKKSFVTRISVEKLNNNEWVFIPPKVTEQVLNELQITYPEELTTLLNILNIIYSTNDAHLRNELIDLFSSLTYRNRTYWLVSYAFFNNDEARKCIESCPKLWALADGLQS